MKIDFGHLNFKDIQPSNSTDQEVLRFIASWFSEDETIAVQTSGSTGTAKRIHILKEKMRFSARRTCDFLYLKPGDKALLCLPIQYISGMMMVARAAERNLILSTVQPSSKPLQEVSENFDFCAMTPLQAENSLYKLHLIKNIIIGGAAVSHLLKQKICDQLYSKNSKSKIFETYGMTETLSHIALKQIYPSQDEYFTVFDEVSIDVDSRGCLKIFVPGIAPHWLQTNDIVQCKNDKQFKFLGRTDHVINSGGAKIHPEEIEESIKQHIDRELVVLGVKDELLGQKIALVIEGNEDAGIRSAVEKISFQKKFHRPKEIFFIPALPRTPNGKISRIETKNILHL